jgi:hypothetical protein
MTAHTFVAKETGPCVILATGNRPDDLEGVYRRSEVALRYEPGPDLDTTDPERRGRWEVQSPKQLGGTPVGCAAIALPGVRRIGSDTDDLRRVLSCFSICAGYALHTPVSARR